MNQVIGFDGSLLQFPDELTTLWFGAFYAVFVL